eukprot:6194708-Pleurochrysis_carterae.AAC.4
MRERTSGAHARISLNGGIANRVGLEATVGGRLHTAAVVDVNIASILAVATAVVTAVAAAAVVTVVTAPITAVTLAVMILAGAAVAAASASHSPLLRSVLLGRAVRLAAVVVVGGVDVPVIFAVVLVAVVLVPVPEV